MSDFLEELKQESKIINENYRKKKYFFKILNILFFVVILTMILGYAFLYANLKVNFYDKASFIFKILLVIIFFRGVAIIDEDITKIPGKTMLRFFEFIVIISLNLIPKLDFTKLTRVGINATVTFFVIFLIGIIVYNNLKRKKLMIVLITVLICILNKYSFIQSKNLFLFAWLIVILYDIFTTFRQKIEKYELYDFSKKYAFSYVYLLYSLFILMYINLKI